VLAHAERIPNHTWVESVRRDRYEGITGPPALSCDALLARRNLPGFSSSLRLAATDRLRLDVLLASDRELYSWAGAEKFEEGEIDGLVTQGAFGTGPFASMLLSVLHGSDTRFIFDGDTPLGGRRLLEYSFSVRVDRSRYRVKAQKDLGGDRLYRNHSRRPDDGGTGAVQRPHGGTAGGNRKLRGRQRTGVQHGAARRGRLPIAPDDAPAIHHARWCPDCFPDCCGGWCLLWEAVDPHCATSG